MQRALAINSKRGFSLIELIADLPPGTSPLSKLDLGPFEVHSMV
jgi:hypothetical protein